MKFLEKKLPEEFGTKKEPVTVSPYAHMTPADFVQMIEVIENGDRDNKTADPVL